MKNIVIVVSQGEKGHKVSVNGLQNGIEYSSPRYANKEAIALKAHHYPEAKIILSKETA